MVVGLGNNEPRYNYSPHNIGFHVLDRLVAKWSKEKDRVQTAKLGDVKLIKPLSLMNVSGETVRWALDYWKVPPPQILVVVDDFALPWGSLRIRREGSDGGHNGLKSLIEHFK